MKPSLRWATENLLHRGVTRLDDPDILRDPYAHYEQLRREQPVSRVQARILVRGTGYLLTRFDDVSTMHTDPRFSSDMITHSGAARFKFLMPEMMRLLTDSMAFKDEPDHKRLKMLVHKAFTPKLVMGMADDITRIVEEHLDKLEAKGDVELVEDFAIQVPLAVIATIMGISDADRTRFHEWTTVITDAAGAGPIGILKTLPTARKLVKLFEDLAEDARLHPNDGLISALVQANAEGDRLSDREVLAMTFLLLLAGHDTTANLIGSSVLALLQNPDQLARLRQDPSLMDRGIEELLRYTTPVPMGTTRYALEDIEIDGTVIPKGSQVLGLIISANRDPSAFPDPDTLDLTREPNRHLSFALGPHYCLGHQLARMEGKIALNALLARFDQLELAVPADQLQYKPSTALRGLTALPMRVGTRSAVGA